ncbi:MAG: hypothetical protein P8Y69_11100 [Gammaproteobacteria bacterium]
MLPNQARLPLSIASPPEWLPVLAVHYRSTPGDADAERMDELLDGGGTLTFEGPAGDVILAPDDDRPLVLVSGGTGIGQALGLATAQTIRHPRTRILHVACTDHEEDVYFRDLLPQSAAYRHVLITDPDRSTNNRGLRWLIDNAAQIDRGGASRIVLSGSPAFVFAVTDVLKAMGIASGRIASDAYAFA